MTHSVAIERQVPSQTLSAFGWQSDSLRKYDNSITLASRFDFKTLNEIWIDFLHEALDKTGTEFPFFKKDFQRLIGASFLFLFSFLSSCNDQFFLTIFTELEIFQETFTGTKFPDFP